MINKILPQGRTEGYPNLNGKFVYPLAKRDRNYYGLTDETREALNALWTQYPRQKVLEN